MDGGLWERASELHAEASESLVRAGSDIPAERWSQPLGPGKWTPAQVVQHLNLGYEAILRELNGGPAMQLRMNWWMRTVLRWTVLPRILRGEPFPRARAPRETRPADAPTDQRAAIESFRTRAEEFARTVSRRNGSGVKLTHPYFGKIKLPHTILLVARHLDHHRRQLASGL